MKPKPNFDWMRVRWTSHAPDSCSYCGAAFRKKEVPLRLFARDGELGSAICEACKCKYFGFGPLLPEED